MPVNEDLLKSWLKALRSGKYVQGRNHLRCGDYFCCLGVLCDLVKDDHSRWLAVEKDHISQYSYAGGMAEDGILPDALAKALGLQYHTGRFVVTEELYKQFPKLPNPAYEPGQISCTLIALNDEHKWTFAEIADLVEARPRGMFSK